MVALKEASSLKKEASTKPEGETHAPREPLKTEIPTNTVLKPAIDPVKLAAEKKYSRPVAGITPKQKDNAKRWL